MSVPDLMGSVTEVYLRMCGGDSQAAGDLWRRFYPRLVGLARKTLAHRPQRATDADDAVQSAFISFWRRVDKGELTDLENRDDLWSLLGVITMRKAMQHALKEQRRKRGGGKVRGEADLGDGSGAASLEALSTQSKAPRMSAQEVDMICEEMLLALDEEMRAIAIYKLMGHTTVEIADRLQCTTRKIERKTALIRDIWKAEQGIE